MVGRIVSRLARGPVAAGDRPSEERPQPDPDSRERVRIRVTRGDEQWLIRPSEFDDFGFRQGDELAVVPAEEAAKLPVTWGDVVVPVEAERSIRVPPRMEFFEYDGWRLPVHLVELTGAGPDTFDAIGAAHVANFQRFMGIEPGMTLLEVGCGIGRDALQLVDLLGRSGRYVGVDVTWDSIAWCRRNISKRHPHFEFHHVDAFSELYNPFGSTSTAQITLPVESGSVDRITAVSLFTHLLEDEILRYLHEFRRVLKPSGLVYATFFLHSAAALAAAANAGHTAWKATFEHPYGGGFFGNDPVYPRGAVAFTDEAMQRMLAAAGLRPVRPYLKGWWSGLHDEPDDGQDGVILGIDDGSRSGR